jgi:hypothetical protein
VGLTALDGVLDGVEVPTGSGQDLVGVHAFHKFGRSQGPETPGAQSRAANGPAKGEPLATRCSSHGCATPPIQGVDVRIGLLELSEGATWVRRRA